MHSVVHVNLHCRVASSHLHRPRANVERDVHFKKELDFLIYMRRLAAGVKPCIPDEKQFFQETLYQCSYRRANAYVGGPNLLTWEGIYQEPLWISLFDR